MEFLINISFQWDADVPEEERQRLRIEERAHAAKLAEKGHLLRMWRVPGRRENWGLWRAKDATEMHEILTTLPIWPWMNVNVMPLADHPVDPARSAAKG